MRIVIFGTGEIYQTNKDRIPESDCILGFLDNNVKLHNTMLDEKLIVAPIQIKKMYYDKIILMSVFASEMREQLLTYGCQESEILHYKEYFAYHNNFTPIYYGKEIKNYENSCLIISNPLGYHGGSIAAVYLAEALIKRSYDVAIVAAQIEMSFINEINNGNITFILHENIECLPWEEMPWIHMFKYIVINTLPMITVAFQIAKYRKVSVWLHDSIVTYRSMRYWENQIKELVDNQNVYFCAVSDQAKSNFIRVFGERKIDILLCGIPEKKTYCKRSGSGNRKFVFAQIGQISQIKGQDIFLQGINKFCNMRTEEVEFWFVGKKGDRDTTEQLIEVVNTMPSVKFMGELSRKELDEVYRQVNVFIIPSRQETLSLVAIEAMKYGKISIVSSQVGISQYIENGKNGWIINTEDIEELSKKMEWCFDNRESVKEMGNEARKIYEEYFSMDIFGRHAEEVLLRR